LKVEGLVVQQIECWFP